MKKPIEYSHIAAALEVGAWLQHFEERVLDGKPEDIIWATDKVVRMLHQTKAVALTPKQIAEIIVRDWRNK